jgi:ankyrin repeat protein
MVARLLLEKGAYIAAKNGYGDTAPHLAASGGHEVVAQLLEKEANG